MKPNKEYLDWISKKLDNMNSLEGGSGVKKNSNPDTYKIPSLMDQMGATAKAYLDQNRSKE